MKSKFRHSKDADGSCSEMGAAAENKFLLLCKESGVPVKTSSEFEDKKGVDFWVQFALEDWQGLDVKAIKRKSRGGAFCSETIWIEILNVRGAAGWLDKDAKYLAFEDEEGFVIVERARLKTKVMSLLKSKGAKQVDSPKDALYNLYTRKGRKDLLTIITKDDLMGVDGRFLL